MKRKATVGIIAIIILICSIVIFRSIYIQRSYYPMGGEVTILAKQADNYGYYITVEQGKPDDAGWGQFELKCTQEQYEAVDVGDVVKCDREQSIVTNSGTVHKIQKRYHRWTRANTVLTGRNVPMLRQNPWPYKRMPCGLFLAWTHFCSGKTAWKPKRP